MLSFADDIAAFAENEKNVSNMLIKTNNSLKEYHMEINQRKIKILNI